MSYQLPESTRITKEQAQKMIEEKGHINVWSNFEREEYFFSSHYRFPQEMKDKLNHDEFVPCSVSIPLTATPREGLESGIISNIDEYLFVFHKDEKEFEWPKKD